MQYQAVGGVQQKQSRPIHLLDRGAPQFAVRILSKDIAGAVKGPDDLHAALLDELKSFDRHVSARCARASQFNKGDTLIFRYGWQQIFAATLFVKIQAASNREIKLAGRVSQRLIEPGVEPRRAETQQRQLFVGDVPLIGRSDVRAASRID
jgi:hypothetical protein